MGLDGKWVELLKANGWQFACLALACAGILLADRNAWLPIALDAFSKQVIVIAGFALFALWVAAIGSAVSEWWTLQVRKFKRRRAIEAHAKEFRDYIPYMLPEEKAIFAQLLHQNRKTFTAADDGGHASTLLGRKFVVILAVRGQTISLEDVPFAVPDHIWKIAQEHKSEFPFKPDPRGADAWRVHWMVR